MAKGQKRSIRFDELLEQRIEREEGSNFTDKLHLVLNDYYSDDREKYLDELEVRTKAKLKQLKEIQKALDKAQSAIRTSVYNLF